MTKEIRMKPSLMLKANQLMRDNHMLRANTLNSPITSCSLVLEAIGDEEEDFDNPCQQPNKESSIKVLFSNLMKVLLI